jgi:hypothetical protein
VAASLRRSLRCGGSGLRGPHELIELSRAPTTSEVAASEPRHRARGEEEQSPSLARRRRAYGGRIRRQRVEVEDEERVRRMLQIRATGTSMAAVVQSNQGSPHLRMLLPLLPCDVQDSRPPRALTCGVAARGPFASSCSITCDTAGRPPARSTPPSEPMLRRSEAARGEATEEQQHAFHGAAGATGPQMQQGMRGLPKRRFAVLFPSLFASYRAFADAYHLVRWIQS